MLVRVAIGLLPFTLCALFLRHVARPGGELNPGRTLTATGSRQKIGSTQKSLEYVIKTEDRKTHRNNLKRIPRAYFDFDDDAAYTWDDDEYKWAHIGSKGPYRSNFKNCSARTCAQLWPDKVYNTSVSGFKQYRKTGLQSHSMCQADYAGDIPTTDDSAIDIMGRVYSGEYRRGGYSTYARKCNYDRGDVCAGSANDTTMPTANGAEYSDVDDDLDRLITTNELDGYVSELIDERCYQDWLGTPTGSSSTDSYQNANMFCKSFGARLCTALELLNQEATGDLGCKINTGLSNSMGKDFYAGYVWSSTPCDESDDDASYVTNYEANRNYRWLVYRFGDSNDYLRNDDTIGDVRLARDGVVGASTMACVHRDLNRAAYTATGSAKRNNRQVCCADRFCGYDPSDRDKYTFIPTALPTSTPTFVPTYLPTARPTQLPTPYPTGAPTPLPTPLPTPSPTAPTQVPTPLPTPLPTSQPTSLPTAQPTSLPTPQPTTLPTPQPTSLPTPQPTSLPTHQPTSLPTAQPTALPTAQPTTLPTPQPTPLPTAQPTPLPTSQPSPLPTAQPTSVPTPQPTSLPTPQPTPIPTPKPTPVPTLPPTQIPGSDDEFSSASSDTTITFSSSLGLTTDGSVTASTFADGSAEETAFEAVVAAAVSNVDADDVEVTSVSDSSRRFRARRLLSGYVTVDFDMTVDLQVNGYSTAETTAAFDATVAQLTAAVNTSSAFNFTNTILGKAVVLDASSYTAPTSFTVNSEYDHSSLGVVAPTTYVASTLVPIVFLGIAALLFSMWRTRDLRAKMDDGNDHPDIVLLSTYSSPGDANIKQPASMYDWAKGLVSTQQRAAAAGASTELTATSKDERIRAKRKRQLRQSIFEVINENMRKLGVTPAAMFAEFDEDGSGELSYWEFTKGVEKLGVKLSDARAELIMEFLDEDRSGAIGLQEFELAVEMAIFQKAGVSMPDLPTPLDPIWNKLHFGLGGQSIHAIVRMLDPDSKGLLTQNEFAKLLGLRGVLVSKNDLERIYDEVDPDDAGVVDMTLLASQMSLALARTETKVLTQLYAASQSRGGVGYFASFCAAGTRLLNYTGVKLAAEELKAGVRKEELLLVFSSLDSQDSGHISFETFAHALVAAWHKTLTPIWAKIRESPVGCLPGTQFVRFLAGDQPSLSFAVFSEVLVERGIRLKEWEVLILSIQIGNVQGLIAGADIAFYLDLSSMLVIHDIYSRLQAFCEIEGIDLIDALEAEDQKQNGYLSTVKLLNMFKTLGLRLSSSEQMLLISRLDPTNSGKIYNKELVQQAKAEYNMEDLLRLVSETLGPPGGAQLFEFLDSGNVITLSTLMARLRQLGLEVGDLEETVPELRLRSDGQFSVDNFMMLVEAHRVRMEQVVWMKVIAELGNEAFRQIDLEAEGSMLSFEQMTEAVEAAGVELTEHELRTLLLSLDPYDTGLIRTEDFRLKTQRAVARQTKPVALEASATIGPSTVQKKPVASTKIEEQEQKEDIDMDHVWSELVSYIFDKNISVKAMFRKFDTDGNGYLSYWEFYQGLQDVGLTQLTEDEIELLMTDLDPEETGKVRYPVFKAKLKSMRPQKTGWLDYLFTGDDEESDEDYTSFAESDGMTQFEQGSLAMVLHPSGEFYRATVIRDNRDGTCNIKYEISTLGAEPEVEKERIQTMEEHQRLERTWNRVNNLLGLDGVSKLTENADFTGKMSHEAFLDTLSKFGVSLSEEQVAMLLFDVDPLKRGVIPVDKVAQKLSAFRAKAHLEGTESLAPSAADAEAGHSQVDNSVPSSRVLELESLILAMSRRQQELALALSASEAKNSALGNEVIELGGGRPAAAETPKDGMYIVPMSSGKESGGQGAWVNKSTGLKFARTSASSGEKKKRGSKAPRKSKKKSAEKA